MTVNLYECARPLVFTYFKTVNFIKVVGIENFPKQNGVLLCSNHINNLDPPLVGAVCPRIVYFMAKAELFKVPILKSLLPHIYAFPVKRGSGDRQALRDGLKILDSGGVMGFFPEGTRSKNGKLGKGLSGAGFFALRSTADIVPCAILGSYRPFRKMKIVYGEPIDFSDLRKQKTPLDMATRRIMDHIQALIDEHENGSDDSKA